MFCSNISWHKTTERKGPFVFLFATAFPWFLVSLYEYLWGGAAVLGVISTCGSAFRNDRLPKSGVWLDDRMWSELGRDLMLVWWEEVEDLYM